ncbi:MAG: HAD family hydrolase [Candidatus Heimdallarchaeota archaeon]|nr:HAD family hydrolase [Candidatus Heimdallarchaeota archaeon]MCK4289860.1 HAD family hydrolase [Candidatus Heimdallarchaeota archaeon]
MIKLVTLDFDGTTADTMPTLEEIAVKLITKYYELEIEDARTKYQITTGLPFEQQMEIVFPENPNNKLVISQFEKEKIESIFDLPLFNDAKSTINLLRELGYLVAISSSTTQPIIEKYCKKNELIVDQIVGYRIGFEKGKDHFDFLKKEFNLKAEELVYVGDSLKDCERAQNSDIVFIGKTGMFTREDFNKISKSKIVISDLEELIKIIPDLNQELD